jgi:hypothetical protein
VITTGFQIWFEYRYSIWNRPIFISSVESYSTLAFQNRYMKTCLSGCVWRSCMIPPLFSVIQKISTQEHHRWRICNCSIRTLELSMDFLPPKLDYLLINDGVLVVPWKFILAFITGNRTCIVGRGWSATWSPWISCVLSMYQIDILWLLWSFWVLSFATY